MKVVYWEGMLIYFSGIGGVAIGPLAEIALGAGYEATGSDLQPSLMTEQLSSRGVNVVIGQSGAEIAAVHAKTPVDWLVYTSALPDDHPELQFARDNNIRATKRDQFLSHLIAEKKLKLIAVAGTHGKTTTSGMLVWVFEQLGIPVSYSVGTTLTFAESGRFDPESEYFVYECDEYDRNMLHYQPFLSVITSLGYDHPDTYKNEHVYKSAFVEFVKQSFSTILWEKDLRYLSQPDMAATYEAYDELMNLSHIHLPGEHTRQNAFLVERTLLKLFPDIPRSQILEAINSFPGTGRRFEKLGDNLYSDYGHHPVEIAATLQLARELSDHVVLIYQPHQNIRQHHVRDQYASCMELAEEIHWLPTYLSREDPTLEILTPEQLTTSLVNRQAVHYSQLDNELWRAVQSARKAGKLVLFMGAGDIDTWLRSQLT